MTEFKPLDVIRNLEGQSLTHAEHRLLVSGVMHADSRGKVKLSHDRLAEAAQIDRRTMQRALRKLEGCYFDVEVKGRWVNLTWRPIETWKGGVVPPLKGGVVPPIDDHEGRHGAHKGRHGVAKGRRDAAPSASHLPPHLPQAAGDDAVEDTKDERRRRPITTNEWLAARSSEDRNALMRRIAKQKGCDVGPGLLRVMTVDELEDWMGTIQNERNDEADRLIRNARSDDAAAFDRCHRVHSRLLTNNITAEVEELSGAIRAIHDGTLTLAEAYDRYPCAHATEAEDADKMFAEMEREWDDDDEEVGS